MIQNKYMTIALKEALKAYKINEIPVGAVIVLDDKVIAKAYNKKEIKKDVTAHAEIIAIKKAEKKLSNWRLDNCTIYSTLEPCPMCMQVIKEARIKNIYFGAHTSKLSIKDINFNENINVVGGIEEEKCLSLIQDFFKKLRNE
jgi:tRNA(adenine34) deaminase